METIKGTYANALVYSDDMEEYSSAAFKGEWGEGDHTREHEGWHHNGDR